MRNIADVTGKIHLDSRDSDPARREVVARPRATSGPSSGAERARRTSGLSAVRVALFAPRCAARTRTSVESVAESSRGRVFVSCRSIARDEDRSDL